MDGDYNNWYNFITHMNGTKWVIIGILLLILEVATGTTYILWPAIAAIIVGVVTYLLPLSWQMQYVLFFMIAIALLVYGQIYVRPRMTDGAADDLNDRAGAMIGQTVKAVEDFDAGYGRVKVGDTQWRAQSVDGASVKTGDALTIKSVKGTTLMVTPAAIS